MKNKTKEYVAFILRIEEKRLKKLRVLEVIKNKETNNGTRTVSTN